MAKIRNISGEARHVAELHWKTVDVDEVVEVPDDRLDAYTCQPETWAAEASAAPLAIDSKKKGA